MMTQQQLFSRALVSSKWLAEALRARKLGPGLRLLEVIYQLPGQRDTEQKSHIPGAISFNVEACRNHDSPYPVMLPSEREFGDYVGSLGVGNDTHVVVYDGDQLGSFYAPRAWWMFRAFGHRGVSVLDGGFRNWVREGHPVTAQVTHPEPAQFRAVLDRRLVKSFEEMLENLQSKMFQVVDSRTEQQYCGTPIEKGASHGHIPSTVNMPFVNFFTTSGHQKQPDEIRILFQEKKVDLSKPLAATCQRGVTACSVALAAHLLGKDDVAVYDGSWSEWVSRAKSEHIIKAGKRNSG
ncbi:thiosulfate sulfurtransferase-like [Ambystoma mexicanum]|uniref:thiosulfate sulfurtransferase-like n=1 Tax=Ambystoma mexicanum TaxID=8296 RepID=UPI0037E8F2C1